MTSIPTAANVDMTLTSDTASALSDLLDALSSAGMSVRIRSARRTCAQQAEQYAIGRSGPDDTRSPTTYAPGCRSWHVLGRAVDIDILSGGTYPQMGTIAEGLGWVWGGRFSGFGSGGDAGHVEWHPGMTIEQACPDPSACSDAIDVGSSVTGGPLAFFVGLAAGGFAIWTAKTMGWI